MSEFSERSLSKLSTCDSRLQELFKRVVGIMDCTILVGHRTHDDQNEAFRTGRSQLQWPNSPHNTIPSRAVDAAPYPIPKEWHPYNFILLAGVVKAEAHHMGLQIRWGGDWNSNDDMMDNRFNDLVHFELVA